MFDDDGVYVYKYHVDWTTPSASTLTGPTKITVARYHYLCDGQLTNCVPQMGSTTRLDAQGDKLMQRLVYRNFGDHQSLVITHSINGPTSGGGLRWYEFRVDAAGNRHTLSAEYVRARHRLPLARQRGDGRPRQHRRRLLDRQRRRAPRASASPPAPRRTRWERWDFASRC